MSNIKYVILGVLLLFLQLLISEYVNIWPMLYIAVFPLFLIHLPYNANNYFSLLLAFILGLLIDITSDGVLGLNAAACVAVAFFRQPLLHLILNKASFNNITDINEKSFGSSKFILLTIILYTIFFFFYIGLDSIGYFSFLYTLIRLFINVFINTAIVIILEKTLIRQLFN